MNLKKLKIIGTILAFIFCFLFHFLYDIIPSFITSIISPVNESIAEHMKILFNGIMLSGIIQKIIVIKNKNNYKNICISNFIAAISSIFIFLIIYLPIYNTIGENLPITLIIMLLVIIISQLITIKIIKLKKDLKMEKASIILVIITYFIFYLLTYYPPKISLFMDPKNHVYGITN